MGRFALIEERTTGTSPEPALLRRYQHSDHLGSSCLETNDLGEVISYEEYHPFGTTAYQVSLRSLPSSAKRYRFCGKEKDEESGLYYYGARYYASGLGRFVSVDPKESKYFFQSSYAYAENSPVTKMDFNGEGSENQEVDLKKETVFISATTGKFLGSAVITGVAPGVRSISEYDYNLLSGNNNNFKPINPGTDYETSIEKSTKEVTIDTEKLKKDIVEIAKNEVGKVDGMWKEKAFSLIFDNEKSLITSVLNDSSENTNGGTISPVVYPDLDLKITFFNSAFTQIQLASVHTHPLTGGGKKMEASIGKSSIKLGDAGEKNVPGTSLGDWKKAVKEQIVEFAIATYMDTSNGQTDPSKVQVFSISPKAKNDTEFELLTNPMTLVQDPILLVQSTIFKR